MFSDFLFMVLNLIMPINYDYNQNNITWFLFLFLLPGIIRFEIKFPFVLNNTFMVIKNKKNHYLLFKVSNVLLEKWLKVPNIFLKKIKWNIQKTCSFHIEIKIYNKECVYIKI